MCNKNKIVKSIDSGEGNLPIQASQRTISENGNRESLQLSSRIVSAPILGHQAPFSNNSFTPKIVPFTARFGNLDSSGSLTRKLFDVTYFFIARILTSFQRHKKVPVRSPLPAMIYASPFRCRFSSFSY